MLNRRPGLTFSKMISDHIFLNFSVFNRNIISPFVPPTIEMVGMNGPIIVEVYFESENVCFLLCVYVRMYVKAHTAGFSLFTLASYEGLISLSVMQNTN